MTDAERGERLLELLEEDDREVLDEIVDQFVASELICASPATLGAAADAFQMSTEDKPLEEAIVAHWLAALLRARAAAFRTH